ncbi:hypothetical protein ACTXI0_14650 [Arthrobacter rhombi]|uniref:hypothetical protein n=1 Tax=Arthrobacter rhombi TaxID=71253 RepID=UPI003FD4500B
MTVVQGLDGFLGARWKHQAYASTLVRRSDGAVLTVKDAVGVNESRYGEDSEPDWVLPTAQVRSGATPRGAAASILDRMALEPSMGRMLVHDFRPATGGAHSAGGSDTGHEFFVYDGGTWVTEVERFTADGGLLQVRFCPLDQLPILLPPGDAERAAAGVRSLELGGVTELEHGRDMTPRHVPGNRQPPRGLMPELPATAPVPGLRQTRG